MGDLISTDPGWPGYDADGGDAFDPVFLRRRAEERPGDWRGWLRLGYVLERGCAADAIPVLERATALAPQNALAHYLLGRVLASAGERARAMREMEIVVRLRPSNHHAWTILGHFHLGKGQVDRALDAFLQAAKLAPDGEGYWCIGRCFLMQDRFDEATVALEEAARLKPDHLLVHRALVYLGEIHGEPDVAHRHMETLFALNKEMALALQEDLNRKVVTSSTISMSRRS